MEIRYEAMDCFDGWAVVLIHGAGDTAYVETVSPPMRNQEAAKDLAAALNMGRQQRMLEIVRNAGS